MRRRLATCCALAAMTAGATAQELVRDADADIRVPQGFDAVIFADDIGRARHLTVRDNGDVIVALRDGHLVGLRDVDGDGRAERREERDVAVHTSVAVKGDYLYFADTRTVSRIKLEGGEGLLPDGTPETIVSGFLDQRSHAAKTFALSENGDLFVNVGAPSNACQQRARTPGSPGQSPCPQLERQAGIWRFEADKVGQIQADGERYVTGVRNAVALAWNPGADALYLVNHGRDQLSQLFGDFYTERQSAELPSEEFHKVAAGDDLGWPYTYYDHIAGGRMVAPEYGGDGKTMSDGPYEAPEIAFPGHWAPNDILFYPEEGGSFPADHAGKAFIAFHGSWNRAPLPQRGYKVVLADPETGEWSDFAAGFAGEGEIASPRNADHRPTGLAVGPDGALYVADSMKGRIYRITYDG